GESLYEFWGERLSHALLDALQDHSEPVVLNLASNEYFKSVAKGLKKVRIRIVEPRFLHDKQGVLKSPGFAAKRARGQMARFVLENRIEAPEDCTAFAADGYRWNGELSTSNRPVFVKQIV
ncbi:MAG: peroxide stress protein YaaA, partial [Bacteroidota bacterium]